MCSVYKLLEVLYSDGELKDYFNKHNRMHSLKII
jgi:hypothetical protein